MGWVYLANRHLSISWMPALEKIIDNFCNDIVPHEDFRLWLSSSPHPKFPISVLQLSIKMTTEPPQGLRANLNRLYDQITEERLERCSETVTPKYKKLLFSLCWFHALILERRKFRSLGWAIPYEFNDSDFNICEDILGIYLEEYQEKTPFEALRYLIGEVNYGGRVTDDWDRRLLNVYMAQFFCEEALSVPNYMLSAAQQYYIPVDGRKDHYKHHISRLPPADLTLAFGQHANAEVASQRTTTSNFLGTLLDMQPRVVVDGEESNDDKVLRVIRDIAENLMEPFDMYVVDQQLIGRSDPDPLQEVLRQEIDRYNALIRVLNSSVVDLDRGIQGLIVITTELEEIYEAVLVGRVPGPWSFAYPSLKPLGSWTSNMLERVSQMREWVFQGMPKVFWLQGFTYPTGFLTALLQTSARKNVVSIDSLTSEFPIISQDAGSITQHPKEGAYMKGIFLEGATWDLDSSCLADSPSMVLMSHMPIIHFKPIEGKKKSKNMYASPCYMYPVRTGTRERHPFVVAIDLKSGDHVAEFWTKRGTACLLSTTD